MSNNQHDPSTSNIENQTKDPLQHEVASTQQPSVSTSLNSQRRETEQLEVMQFLEMEDVLSKMDKQIEFNHSTLPQQQQQTFNNTSSQNNSHRHSKTVQQQENQTTIPIQKVIQSKTEDTCYQHVASLLVNLNDIKVSFDIMLGSSLSKQRLLSEVNSTMKVVSKELDALILDIPSYNKVNNLSRESIIPMLRKNFNDFQTVQTIMFNNVVNNVKDFNFYKFNYLTQLQILVNSLGDPLIIADRAAYNEDVYMNYSAGVNLILVSITLLIIVPVMVIVLIITIGRDNLFMDKLKKADAHVIIEVMEDDRLHILFKEFCKLNNQYSKVLFLEKVMLYKEQCEKVYDLHDQIESLSDVSGGEASKSLSHEVDILEAKKFELAFEIITEFLDNDSESFLGVKLLGGKRDIEKVKKTFDEKSMNLPDKLFKSLQTNVAVYLLQTHKLFQAQQRRNREERKKNRLLKLQKHK
ncbi:predicted protein [Naegleria gruberi]|uniref:Predicted protein n=1 Tax=Naegleria gruberi TaxID=5762 RepID=D2V9M0_NAEGR|nr:uncharacterized protein NAEGRDRAFT_65487 [Naegleria gruberi]EFC46487.1 predicted protein [Naegleria gruberi]|eukprot:XP_002679231.1 predicted protein [Naegleria gruberi strain NEG-M]